MYIDGFSTVLDPIKSVQLSLLKKKTDPNKFNKADYLKKKTVKFTFPSDFPKLENYFEALLENMYADLLVDAPDAPDYLGVWIEYDSITLDNAISLSALESIKEYSKEEINPIWEFFKMTLPANDYFQNNFTS